MNRIAPYITKAQSMAKLASEKINGEAIPLISKHYSAMVAQNQQYVVKDPAAASVLHKQLFFTTMDRYCTNIPYVITKFRNTYDDVVCGRFCTCSNAGLRRLCSSWDREPFRRS